MSRTIKKNRDKEIKEPLVVFPLKQYETLMDYIEDIENRLTLPELQDIQLPRASGFAPGFSPGLKKGQYNKNGL